jgi:hypothetical protein
MSDEANTGKSEAELHARDAETYRNPKKDKGSANKWNNTGVCFADHVSGAH